MSLRTIQRLAIMSALAMVGMGMQACGDDDKKDDGGDGDSGDGDTGDGDTGDGDGDTGDGDGDGDGGDGDGMEEPLMCIADEEEAPCDDTVVVEGVFVQKACCDEAAGGACGAKIEQGVLAGCFVKDAPGEPSTHCSAFWDSIDGTDDNGFSSEIAVGAQKLAVTIPGCCTPQGLCGLAMDSVTLSTGTEVNAGVGCIPVTRLLDQVGAAGASSQAEPLSPSCLPQAPNEAACPLFLSESICDQLKSFYPNCDPSKPAPDWFCQMRGLPEVATGVVPSVECMKGVAEFVQGCGANPGASCVPSIPQNVYGCEDVPEQITQIPGVPEYVCGCGEDVKFNGAGIPCLSNVHTAACGAVEVTEAAQLPATIPSSLCGCEDHPQEGSPCLKNVPFSICGTTAVCAAGQVGPDAGCADEATPYCHDFNSDGKGDICVPPPV